MQRGEQALSGRGRDYTQTGFPCSGKNLIREVSASLDLQISVDDRLACGFEESIV